MLNPTRALWRRLSTSGQRALVVGALALGGAELLGLAALYPLRRVLDEALLRAHQDHLLWGLLGVSAACQLASLAVRHAGRRVLDAHGEHEAARLRDLAVARLLAMGARFHLERGHGERMATLTTDVQRARMLLYGELPALAIMALSALVTAAVVGWMAPGMLAVSVPVIVVVLGVGWWGQRRAEQAQEAARQAQARVFGEVMELLSGVEQVIISGTEAAMRARLHEHSAQWAQAQAQVARQRSALVSAIGGLSALALLALLGVGGWLAASGQGLTTGALLVSYAYAARLLLPFRAASGAMFQHATYRASATRLLALLDAVPPTEDPDDPREVGPLQTLMLDAVRFGFAPDQAPVLREVSLRVEAGQRVAILGPSGAGKSTLGRLIARLFDPDAGQLLINDTPMTAMRARDVRARVGYVGQEVFLWDASLRENLCLGAAGEVTEARLSEALRIACAQEIVDALPDGLDARAGRGGARFSGGQRKRLALARALLREPELLIIDQLASDLEADLNARIFDALPRQGRVVIYLGHRVPARFAPDTVYWLERGALTPHDDDQ